MRLKLRRVIFWKSFDPNIISGFNGPYSLMREDINAYFHNAINPFRVVAQIKAEEKIFKVELLNPSIFHPTKLSLEIGAEQKEFKVGE